jgi:hypothetical protein
MRKLYLVLLAVVISSVTFAQQIFLSEDFSSGQMPPTNWTIDNLTSQWSNQNSDNAGGTAPEARFKYKNYNGTSRLISPVIDLTGVSTVVLAFRHFLDNYGGGSYKIGVATRSGSGNWNSIWEVAPSADVGPEAKILQISNTDVGSADFQICFYLTGNLFNLDYWYIDNIKLLVPANLNAEMVAITSPEYIDKPIDVTGTIRNFGNTTINSLDIEWQVNNDVYNTSFTGLNIPFGDTYDFICNDQFDYPTGSYELSVRIKAVNGTADDNSADDTLMKTINVVSHSINKRPCFEEFTSSTCGPCAGFNSQFVPWCEMHADELTLVKYQMDWPGNGDPYYTEEGGERKDYYGVVWVPWLQAEGKFTGTNTSAAQAVLDQAANEPGLMKIASAFSMSKGSTINITTTVLPFANFNDFRVHMVVFEKETTQNTGNNGETSFQHVMMKMIPDANGTSVNLVDRQPQTFTYSVDLSGTNVEEWDDLGVAIICQDYASKKIFQSAYSEQDAAFASEAKLSEIKVNGEALEGFDPDTYSYDVVLPEGTVDIPTVEATLTDDKGTKVIVNANALPGTTTIDAYGEDLASHITYSVNFSIATGVSDNFENSVKVYPNPTTGKIYLAGIDAENVRVYSLTGSLVYENNTVTNDVIDLSDLENGIYFISIKDENNQVVTKKISLMK